MRHIYRVLSISLLLLVCKNTTGALPEESILAKRLYGHWSSEGSNGSFYYSPNVYIKVLDGQCVTAPLKIIEESWLRETVVVRINPQNGDDATESKFEFDKSGIGALVSTRSRELVRIGVVVGGDPKTANRTALVDLPYLKPSSKIRKISDARSPEQTDCKVFR